MKKPNIVYIYADDLGRGTLGCYGQKHYKTPNIDKLASSGMMFNRAYGCAFCAPARASLICGLHDCHAGRWSFTESGIYEHMGIDMSLDDIYEMINNTGFNDLPSTEFLPHVLKRGGYFTGQIGKLEWGFSTSDADIKKHGWDYHYGYYDHRQCHGFYPPFLFEDGNVVDIKGNTHMDCGKTPGTESEENAKIRHDMTGKAQYSQDLFNDKIVEFLEEHKDDQFYLYHPSQLPHGPIMVPEIHAGIKDNPDLTDYEKEYVSMVLRLDDTVGLVVKTLERLNILDNTIVIFSADNGHEVYYAQEGRSHAAESAFTGQAFDEVELSFTTKEANDILDGNDGMKGRKRSNSEGGVRIPYIVSWKGKIEAGSVSDRLIANYDLMPTFAEIGGVEMPEGKDGLSFYKELLSQESEEHEYVVYASHKGPGLTRNDGWKIRYTTANNNFELYKLDEDYAEENELSATYPEKVFEYGKALLRECDGNLENGTPFAHVADMIDEVLLTRDEGGWNRQR